MEDDCIYEPYDSPIRWNIRSSSVHDESYLVDLGANGGVGECQCKGFIFSFAKHRIHGTQIKRCRHINIARDKFTSWAIEAFKRHDQNLPS